MLLRWVCRLPRHCSWTHSRGWSCSPSQVGAAAWYSGLSTRGRHVACPLSLTRIDCQPAEALNAHLAHCEGSRAVGVYVGVSQLEYARISLEAGNSLNTYYATGAHLSVASGALAAGTLLTDGPLRPADSTCVRCLEAALAICCRSAVVHVWLQGTCHDCGHSLLIFPGHHPPGSKGKGLSRPCDDSAVVGNQPGDGCLLLGCRVLSVASARQRAASA